MTFLPHPSGACAIAAAVPSPRSIGSVAPRQSEARRNEFSAAKRIYHRRQVRHYQVRRIRSAITMCADTTPHYSVYRGGNDPSLAPNGGPYRVPAHLRNQCHIDEGYGRFSACPNE